MNAYTNLDERALTRLDGLGGPETARRLIDAFLTHAPLKLDAACSDGLAGNLKALEQAVASLRSGAAKFGANSLEELTRHIQRLAGKGEKDMIFPLLVQLQAELEEVLAMLRIERDRRTP